MSDHSYELRASLDAFDNDDRYAIVVAPQPSSSAVGWVAYGPDGSAYGNAVVLTSSDEDPSVISRLVAESYEQDCPKPTTRRAP